MTGRYLTWNPGEGTGTHSGPRMKFSELTIMAFSRDFDVSHGDDWCQVIVASSRVGVFKPGDELWDSFLELAKIIKSYIGWSRDLELCCVHARSGIAQFSFAKLGSSYYIHAVSREFDERYK